MNIIRYQIYKMIIKLEKRLNQKKIIHNIQTIILNNWVYIKKLKIKRFNKEAVAKEQIVKEVQEEKYYKNGPETEIVVKKNINSLINLLKLKKKI